MASAISQSTPSFQIQQQDAPPSQPMTKTKIQKIALAFFAGVCALFGAALTIVYGTEALFIAIPSFIIAGVCVWIITRLKTYADPIKPTKYRKKAIAAPFQDTVSKHGWENIFKLQLLSPENFKALVLKAADDMKFKDFLKMYAEGEKKRPASSPLVLPKPKEFALLWTKTASQYPSPSYLLASSEFDLDQLVRYGFLPQEFLPAQQEFDNLINDRAEKRNSYYREFLKIIQQPLKSFVEVISRIKADTLTNSEENTRLLKEIASLEAKIDILQIKQFTDPKPVIKAIFAQTFPNPDLTAQQTRFIHDTLQADKSRGKNYISLNEESDERIAQLDSKYSIYLPINKEQLHG